MLEHLFGSKTRVNLLRVFFRDPDRAFYVRELTRLLDVQINAIRRELELLKKIALVKESKKKPADDVKEAGSRLRKYYILNAEAALHGELKALLTRAQLMDEQQLVKELEKKAGDVQLFLLTGRFTGDKKAPIDMLLVGKLKEKTITRLVSKYEKKFGFEVRYTTMTMKEFAERRHMMDKFVYSIFESDNIKIVDKVGV